MPPEAARRLEHALAAVRRRIAARHALEASTAGAAAAVPLAIVLRWAGASRGSTAVALLAVVAAIGGSWFAIRRTRRTRAAAARAIEGARPECRNVVVTAEELLRHRDRVRPWMRARVFGDAATHAEAVAPSAAVRLRPVAIAAAAALTVAAASIAPGRVARVPRGATPASRHAPAAAPGEPRITATLHPPDYIGGDPVTLKDPERITALEGTRLRLAVGGTGWRVRFGETPVPLGIEGSISSADVVLRDSGYLAIEPSGSGAAKRLLPVLVDRDRAPVIRVEDPGRDLLLGAARDVPIRASANDDHGLRAMSLRYTRVSGSGERFEFVEGELPISIAREGSRSWRARGEVPLPSLGLEPGDALVYRVVARDGRAGEAGLASSDTFFIEIAGPGQVALEGFEMPPERERHALSQQMIVLKIERLRARERGLALPAVRERTASIAAEQRTVRANFIFLMGGHVEDEEEEAEQSHEIQEGRLENTARREVSRAVGHMTYAEQALAAVDTRAALREARLAVEALQRAFGRNRYLLRALPVRSRVDPSRRLSGDLDDAGDWRRDAARPPSDPARAVTREIIGRLIALAPAIRAGGASNDVSAELTAAAEKALRVDPADGGWQQIASQVLTLRDAIAAGGSRDDTDRRLRAALDAILVKARRQASQARTDFPPPEDLRSAWAAEMRR